MQPLGPWDGALWQPGLWAPGLWGAGSSQAGFTFTVLMMQLIIQRAHDEEKRGHD
jgi:hypothetical protein